MNILELNLNEVAVISGGKKGGKKTVPVIPASTGNTWTWMGAGKEVLKAGLAFAAPFVGGYVGGWIGGKDSKLQLTCMFVGVGITGSYIATWGIWNW